MNNSPLPRGVVDLAGNVRVHRASQVTAAECDQYFLIRKPPRRIGCEGVRGGEEDEDGAEEHEERRTRGRERERGVRAGRRGNPIWFAVDHS